MSIKQEMKISKEEILKMLSNIKEQETIKNMQKTVCENIKQKVAKSQTMQLEQEEILEDNSILLTIRI